LCIIKPTEAQFREEIEIAQKFSPKGTLPDDFADWCEIKDTVLDGKEMKGIFATQAMPSKLILGEFVGVTYSSSVDKPPLYFADQSYLFMEKFGDRYIYINGITEEKSSWCRYINTARPTSANNAYFFLFEKRAYVCTKKPIDKGEQIFIWYELPNKKK
jgi:hypothetical protein